MSKLRGIVLAGMAGLAGLVRMDHSYDAVLGSKL